MNKTSINIRVNPKNASVLQKVEQIASKRSGSHQFTPTLMELLEIGLNQYNDGYRLVENNVIKINNTDIISSVRREVARSVFTSLAGSLVDIGRNELAKANPDKSKIAFYQLARKALYAQHSKFRYLSDADVEGIFKILSPILKSVRLASSAQERENIIDSNKIVLA